MWWIWPLTTVVAWSTAGILFHQVRHLRRTLVMTTAALERADENQRSMLAHIKAMQNGESSDVNTGG